MKVSISLPLLLTKKDFYTALGYNSMDTIYKKILSDKMLKRIGFSSVQDFKKIRQFNLSQSRAIKEIIVELVSETN